MAPNPALGYDRDKEVDAVLAQFDAEVAQARALIVRCKTRSPGYAADDASSAEAKLYDLVGKLRNLANMFTTDRARRDAEARTKAPPYREGARGGMFKEAGHRAGDRDPISALMGGKE